MTEPGSSKVYWRRALALALVGLVCALLLGGLSAWFLAAVAIAGLSATTALTFNFHIPGALVRLFAIGRTVARYGERLAGHKAALSDQVERRVELFSAMAAAPAVRSAGWQLGDATRLADYLDDVEDLDFGRLRVNLPATAILLGLIGLVVATLAVAPLAVLPIGTLLAGILLAGRRLFASTDEALARVWKARREGAGIMGAAMAAAVPLRAEGELVSQCNKALHALNAADRERFSLHRGLALFDVLCSLAGPVAALAVMASAWLSGARGEALLVPTFLAFAWFAFAETTQGASRLVLAEVKRRAARTRVAQWLTGAPRPETEPHLSSATELTSDGLQRIGPDGRVLGPPIAIRFRAGHPTVLVGASGSGKTSLLKQVAGWTGDDVMTLDGQPIAAHERAAISMLCPHDAAILADTVRANLFARHADDATLWDALAAVELETRIQKGGGLDSWIVQETLSLGEAQRLNLARAYLSDKPVILLDEPMEHLDHEQAARIISRLLDRLSDRIVILSSHRPVDGATKLDLEVMPV